MKIKEAYTTLGLPETASEDEVKKAFRKLAATYHPDVCKDSDAEARFKKINEAHQVITSGKSSDPEDRIPARSPFNPFDDFFRANQSSFHPADNISLTTTISFKESVLGTKKDIKFSRKTKCASCNGQGKTLLNNGCSKCGGRGSIVEKRGNMIFTHSCDKCQGRSQTLPCKPCSGQGVLDSEVSVSVSIPGGIQNDNILRLHGMGHYVGSSFMFQEQCTDVHLQVSVIPEPELTLEGMDVVFTLNISLLEALQGSEKQVKTIDGKQNVKIMPLSKNRDEISLPKMGVNKVGSQRVILNVQYPDQIDPLISALTKGT